jgi:alpha-methylacyl-CoA racemase
VTDSSPDGPLAGLRVLVVGGIGPVLMASMMLADLGADLVWIGRVDEVAPDGEGRRVQPLRRGGRSIAIDLTADAGRELALDLAAASDVVVEGFRPGVAERLGLGPQDVSARNPAVVYGRMTGWGQEGPLAGTAGHDITYIARSGALDAIGRRDAPPTVPLNLVGDFGGGAMLLLVGVLAALRERDRSGSGQTVDAAMVDGASLLMTMFHGFRANGQWADRRGENLLDSGCPYYDVYGTADGRWMAVGALEDKFYQELCRLLEVPARPDRTDPAIWDEMREQFAAAFRGGTQAHWEVVFAGSDACVAPVRSLAEAAADEHALARNSFVEVAGVTLPAPAPRFSRTPGRVRRPPAAVGQHSAEIVHDWLGRDHPDLARAVVQVAPGRAGATREY